MFLPHAPQRTSQGEAVITHEVSITFRLRNTSFQKRKSSPIGLLSFLVAGRGFFIALRRRIVVCRASIHSARHTPCFVRSRGAKRILNPFCLLAPDLLRRSVGLYTTQQPTKKGHRLVSFSLCKGYKKDIFEGVLT